MPTWDLNIQTDENYSLLGHDTVEAIAASNLHVILKMEAASTVS